MKYLLILLVSLSCLTAHAEETYFGGTLTEFTVTRRLTKKQTRQIRDIKVVLPLAKEVKYLYDTQQLSKKELTVQYESKLKKLSWAQGRLLIKLINRECDATAYTVIKQYFNKRTAVLAQSTAWLVGFNLNAKCDTELENLCGMVERREI